MNQPKAMRLVRKEKEIRHMGLLNSDNALRGYQQAYDEAVTRYAITETKDSPWRRFWNRIRRVN